MLFRSDAIDLRSTAVQEDLALLPALSMLRPTHRERLLPSRVDKDLVGDEARGGSVDKVDLGGGGGVLGFEGVVDRGREGLEVRLERCRGVELRAEQSQS